MVPLRSDAWCLWIKQSFAAVFERMKRFDTVDRHSDLDKDAMHSHDPTALGFGSRSVVTACLSESVCWLASQTLR